MRINGHAHIFNLQTVLTTEAVEIICGRIERMKFPDFVVDAVRDFLLIQLERPEYLTEEGLLREMLKAIGKNKKFKALVASGTSALPFEVKMLGDGVEALGADMLRDILDKLSTKYDPQDGSGRSIFSLYETLKLAMQPDIVSVADAIREQIPGDSGLVALMMDIVAKPEPASDKQNFLAQIKGTADAALARPGRIFPFIAVNPNRPDHFEVMKRALEQQGFVGVKLYPSLGYEVTTAPMKKVLEYCHEHDTPIVIHATAGGFFKTPQTAEFSNPKHWDKILTDLPKLRISFAHCGGWGGLSAKDPLQIPWWKSIETLIRGGHPNVYGDLAYHVEMKKTGADEAAYFIALKALLADPAIGPRIIFGTDSWLVRMSMAEQAYWNYFEKHLDFDEFKQICETNPSRFLGLPVAQGEALSGALARHLAWLESHANEVGDEPADWIKAASTVAFTPTRINPRWSPNNAAHVMLFKFLRWDAQEITTEFHPLKFEVSKVRVRQLKYYRERQHIPGPLFGQRVHALASNLDAFMRTNGAGYEGGFDTAKAVAKLQGVFDNGDLTLADVGASSDAIYLFQREIE